MRHSQQESTHIKDISDSEAAVYENQPLGDARKPYRTPAPHKRQDPRRIEDISESAFYKFRPPQEAEIGKYEYDGLVCRGGGESNEHRDKDQNYEYDDNERDRLSNVEVSNGVLIYSSLLTANRRSL